VDVSTTLWILLLLLILDVGLDKLLLLHRVCIHNLLVSVHRLLLNELLLWDKLLLRVCVYRLLIDHVGAGSINRLLLDKLLLLLVNGLNIWLHVHAETHIVSSEICLLVRNCGYSISLVFISRDEFNIEKHTSCTLSLVCQRNPITKFVLVGCDL